VEGHDASREPAGQASEINVDAAGTLARAARHDGDKPDPRTYAGFARLSKGRERVPDSERDWVGLTSESDDLLGCLTWPYVLFGWTVVTARYIVLGLTWPFRRLWRAVRTTGGGS
jgi:hypothetical protein